MPTRQRVAAALASSVGARPQQQQRQAAIAGRELQFLAGLEIEPVDHPRDGCRCARVQRFRHGPESFLALRRLDQNEARGVKSEAVEAMAKKTAAVTAGLASLDWHDEDERAPRLQTRQDCHHEAESGGNGVLRGWHDFMKTAGETTLGKMSVKGAKTEGQGPAVKGPAVSFFEGPQQAAQFADCGTAVRCPTVAPWKP